MHTVISVIYHIYTVHICGWKGAFSQLAPFEDTNVEGLE